MATRSKIKKLCLGPSPAVTAKNSLVGMRVIADYLSDEDAQRYMVFERMGNAANGSESSKGLPRRKVKANQEKHAATQPIARDDGPSPSTMFPPPGVKEA